MSNSPLVDCTIPSPNHSGRRTHGIDRITPHCVVGQLTAEDIGNCFTSKSRQASCNYGVGTEGRVVLSVDEGNRSWCSSSNSNDQRAVTIECASDRTAPYAFNSKVYAKLIDLCADICRRNGKTKLLWLGSKETSLSYTPKSNEMILTVHRWFANKSCPGDWLMARMGDLASQVTARLEGNSGSSSAIPQTNSGNLYRVQVGAYGNKSNADRQLSAVKAKGFDAFEVKVGNLYKIQVGAFGKKSNADNMLAKIKAAGFDAIITGGSTSSSTVHKKSNAEIAKEILQGKWGNGDARKNALKAAGYNYSEVQKEVNKLLR